MLTTRFYVCNCFYTNNMFVKKYNLHVKYRDKAQFLQDYSQVLRSRGCRNPESLIPKLEAESTRRKHFQDESWARRQKVERDYTPLHPHIFTLKSSFMQPEFLQLVEEAQNTDVTAEDIIRKMENHQNRVFSFPVFTHQFCQLLIEELKKFEESPLPKGRPNTMNNYGISLDELGFEKFVTEFRSTYLTPLTRLLYPDWGGDALDSHKAFVVTYKEGKDVDLSYHFDNAEITINVSLNEDYSDGELYFGSMRTEVSSHRFGYAHQLGVGVLHRGQHMHGALPITEGTRYNLIIWMRSSQVRNRLCPMCDEKPVLVPVKQGYGDGFTVISTDVCSVH